MDNANQAAQQLWAAIRICAKGSLYGVSMEMENSKSHILSLSLYQDYNHSQKLQAFTDSLRRNCEKN